MISNTVIDSLKQKSRVGVFVANAVLAIIVYVVVTGTLSPFGTEQGLWLLAVVTYWLFTLVTTPFFIPPKDALANAISTILILAPVSLASVKHFTMVLSILYWVAIGVSLVVVILSLIAIFKRSDGQQSPVGTITYQLSNKLGRGEILFTMVVLISSLGFYQDKIDTALLIMGFWLLMVVIKPVELTLKIYQLFSTELVIEEKDVVGSILRVDDPNIVKVNLINTETSWEHGKVYVSQLSNNKIVHILPLFTQVQNEGVVGTGLLCECNDKNNKEILFGNVYTSTNPKLSKELVKTLSGEDKTKKIAGLVVKNSSIGNIRFQVVKGLNLEEGMVVFCKVQGKKVYYQILDAKTDEESFQTSPYGMHIVSALQLGSFDKEYGFQGFVWLPEMNQPVFLVNEDDVLEQKIEKGEFTVGKIPSTGFEVHIDLNNLVEYHAAILGVTGTGKTELALDIIKNALSEEVKVFCVDFTGEYAPRLKNSNSQTIGLSEEKIEELESALHAVAVGTFGAKEERAALQKFLETIEPDVEKQVDDFLMDEKNNLGIFELSEITNTRATLRITEMYLSSIMKWARKNRKARRVMLVLEEAHTIIPEVYSAGFDADTQWIVGRIGQIALQGRKYGVGLLIMSQRTALVSKTILSQCNTYFTHGLVDKTSLDYLGGVYSPEHVKAIPNLRTREFLASGKAIKSERPLLVRVDFDQAKLDASKALDTTYEEVRDSRKDKEKEDTPEDILI